MVDGAKKSVSLFKKKYKLTEITEGSICNALQKQGYAVIYFNTAFNDENVSQIIGNLKLEETIASHKGFTYSNSKYRLVFVNEDLTEEERLMVLAHEEGHIFCEHVSCQPIIGLDVKQEHIANEFAHYLLHPDKSDKTKSWFMRHKKIVISICACVLLVAVGITVFSIVSKERSYYGGYYITETGSKYHKKNCIFVKNKDNIRRLTKEEFDNGDYEPCDMCLP